MGSTTSSVSVYGVSGGDTVNATAGGATVSITDTNGGNNVVTASGGRSSVTINDTAGHDTISLAGSNNTVTLAGIGGNDQITFQGSHSSDKVVLSQTPSYADTITGFNGGTAASHDTIDVTSLGLLGIDANVSNGLTAHDVGWKYNAATNQTAVYMNTTNATETNLSPTLELKGNVNLAASNFKFGVA